MTARHWLNAVSGSFTNPADWSGGVVPGALDDAILDAAGSAFTVTSGADETVASVQLAANATLRLSAGTFNATSGTGVGANAGVIIVGQGAAFAVGGTFDNSGTIAIGGRRGRAILAPDGNVVLSGGGRIILGGSVHNGIILSGSTPKYSLINVDNTITGAGMIGGQDLLVQNDAAGVINATRSAALTIGNYVIENEGTLKATGSGGLTIDAQFVDNHQTGVVLAGAGSIVRLDTVYMIGGTLRSIGTGVIAAFDSRLNEVVDHANIDVINGGVLSVEGALTNNGIISLAAGPSSTGLFFGFDTLRGSGSIALGSSGDDYLEISDSQYGSEFTNEHNTISGAGTISSPVRLVLTNEAGGLIDANGAAAMTIEADVTNAGTIEATGTGSCVIQENLYNKGTIAAVGGTIWVSGAVTGPGAAIIDGGMLGFLFSTNENVDFIGTTGRLELAHASSFDEAVIGFATTGGTSLDLDDIHFIDPAEATYQGTATRGTLTVSDGVHIARIQMRGDYLGSTFVASSDGHGGTIVVAQGGGEPMAPVHAFIGAMAGFGAPAAHAIHSGGMGPQPEARLALPRTQMA